MLARKDKVVEDLTENVRKLLEGNGIEIIHGKASVPAAGTVEVDTGKKKKTTLSAKNILLATGSEPIEVPGLEFDGTHIVSSTEALAISNPCPNTWASWAAATSAWNWGRCGAGWVPR
jgi:dihydrolipoamide dehydrogenase